jgi:hypothetical protein
MKSNSLCRIAGTDQLIPAFPINSSVAALELENITSFPKNTSFH